MIHNTDNVRSAKVRVVPKKYYSVQGSICGEKIKHVNPIKRKKSIYATWNRKKWKLIAGVCAAITSLTAFTVLASSYSVGYTVMVDDTVVGTVATKNEYYQVLDQVKTEVKDLSNEEFEVAGEETFSVELVKRDSFTEKEELAENLKSTSEEMVSAYGISYEGTLLAALVSEEEANSVLEQYLAQQTFGNKNITAEFVGSVEVAETLVPQGSVSTQASVLDILSAGKTIRHTGAEGESIESVAAQYGVTVDAVTCESPLQKTTDVFGKSLTIYTGEPMFSVKTVEHVNGEVAVAFEIVSEEDATLYTGKTVVDIKGADGIKYVDAYITKIDGVVVEETVLRDEMIKQPITQVQRVGTKAAPASVGTGEFVMPASGTLTSNFGRRWGRSHEGIDVAAKEGTPIYAADNGIVTEAQYKNNGYGNFISIDHGNGYVTYYAHCSALFVSDGDVVAKGDLIGHVGNTGRSTGPHLHFEIRENGTAKNPLSYVK